ncbi:sulfite exporter TauE/SafE family protein [Paracoccus sp. (in: a-proteobacteria)]|uniref:sulfite exporter TauE/SafE family protein n=1 Tax=Paracoccus sp. TaxID=267 RepID=UPI0028977AD5|nr:sulfite exporter TauE/SafE family protein [Paracoccus sp. (in: a-proteobacteria)]
MLSDLISLNTLGLWLVILLGSWLQTLTGFAFGLIVMGGVGALSLMPLPEAAIVSGFLTMVNGALILARKHPAVDRHALGLLLVGSVPGLALGYWLLMYMAGNALVLLQFTLGLMVTLAAIQMMRSPIQLRDRSKNGPFIISGFFSGMMGGMFSTAGPPVIWHLYRQPLSTEAIRCTLVAVFFVGAVLRMGIVFATTGISAQVLLVSAVAVPVVIFGTWLATRHPPRLAPQTMRKLAFGLLFLSGLAMLAPALATFFKEIL